MHYYFRELAENVWNKANLDLNINGLPESLLEDVTSKNPDIQEAAAKALASLLSQLENNSINSIVKKLLNIYQEKLTVSIRGRHVNKKCWWIAWQERKVYNY